MSAIKRSEWLTIRTLLLMGLADIGSIVELEDERLVDMLQLYAGFLANFEDNDILQRILED